MREERRGEGSEIREKGRGGNVTDEEEELREHRGDR